MAIYHLSAQVISAAGGRSAVAAAAYRRAASMTCAATGQSFSYEGKEHVVHTELSLPAETPAWFRTGIDGRSENGASEFLWNAVERKEGLKGTGLAMEMNIALPVDLTREQNVALARDWIEEHVTAKGLIADWAVHDSLGNPHFHLMIPLRRLIEQGFGAKFELARDPAGAVLYREDGKPRYERMAAPMKELLGWRRSWADTANRHLAAAGLERRIDHRSHAESGIAIEPTGHIGVTASNMALNGKEAARVAEERARRARNAQAIVEDPSRLLPILTREKSVFDERDIAKALFRYIDDPALFETVRLRVGLSPELVAVSREVIDPETERVIEPARWTTRALLRAEVAMQVTAGRLWTDRSHALAPTALNAALAARPGLSEQQREAVRHVTSSERIAAVIGFAGAGKSTMLGVANDAWRRAGRRVHGAALAGKAADGLQRSANIPSRTLASWELAWKQERDVLGKGDVFVLDEAGMVSSEQLSRIVREVERRGAKLVLVGDAMQLQPIEAGAAFRAITETVGYVELAEIWRQSAPWMRAASVAFARGEVEAALGAYRDAGMVRFTPTRAAALDSVIAAWKPDYLAEQADGRPTETLILAHANQDVFRLNAMARDALKADGRLAGEARFVTARGERMLAPGDRLLFLENDARLGVKNGMLASVEVAEAGRLTVRLDRDGKGDGRRVEVRASEYRNVDHGYAATVHKSQGATLDRLHVLATPGMDRHLAYVAMTRHRDRVVLHASHEDFLSQRRRDAVEGKLGDAPTVEDYDRAALAGLTRRLSRDGAKETTLDYADREAFREAASSIEAPVSPGDLEALAQRLDEAERLERLMADRVRPQDVRALASAFAERRGMNAHATILPGLLARLRGLVRELERRWQRLQGVSTRLGAAWAGMQARAGHVRRPEDPQEEVPPRAIEPGAAAPEVVPSVACERPAAPSEPFMAAVDLGESGLEEAALSRISGDPGLARLKADLAGAVADMVRSPEPLATAILAELASPRASFTERLTALLATPDAYGGLRGRTGLLASRSAKDERHWAKQAGVAVQSGAQELKQRFDAKVAEARAVEQTYRARLRVEVPGLSPAAQRALLTIGQASMEARSDAVMRAVADPGLRREIKAFAQAVGRRFGANGSIGFRMEQHLPPGHAEVTRPQRELLNGAGIIAARIERGELDQDLVPVQERRNDRSRELGL